MLRLFRQLASPARATVADIAESMAASPKTRH
jgi:hypothetical protein